MLNNGRISIIKSLPESWGRGLLNYRIIIARDVFCYTRNMVFFSIRYFLSIFESIIIFLEINDQTLLHKDQYRRPQIQSFIEIIV